MKYELFLQPKVLRINNLEIATIEKHEIKGWQNDGHTAYIINSSLGERFCSLKQRCFGFQPKTIAKTLERDVLACTRLVDIL